MAVGKSVMALLAAAILAVAAPVAAQEGTPEGERVTVGETEVSWSGAWEIDEDASTDELVTLKIEDDTAPAVRLATYAEMADETVDGASEALSVFAEAFLSDPGVASAMETGAGDLDDGEVWSVFTYDLNGVAVATVFTVSEIEEGTFAVSTLTATIPVFAETVAAAQQEILLDGEPVFLEGIDGAAIVPSPVASPGATPAN